MAPPALDRKRLGPPPSGHLSGDENVGQAILRVTGRVRDALTGSTAPGATLCVSHGHDGVGSYPADVDGRVVCRVEGLEPGRYLLTFLADGRAPDRRGVIVEDVLEIDVGDVTLPPVEYAPGVHGTLWDAVADVPVTRGRVVLAEVGTEPRAQATTDPDGRFDIPLTCKRPLPPGDYLLEAEADGYATSRTPFPITEPRTVHELGRVMLERQDA